MCKSIRLRHTRVQAESGLTMRDLYWRIVKGHFEVANHDLVGIHVGINNLDVLPGEFEMQLYRVIRQIKMKTQGKVRLSYLPYYQALKFILIKKNGGSS